MTAQRWAVVVVVVTSVLAGAAFTFVPAGSTLRICGTWVQPKTLEVSIEENDRDVRRALASYVRGHPNQQVFLEPLDPAELDRQCDDSRDRRRTLAVGSVLIVLLGSMAAVLVRRRYARTA